VVSYNVDWRQTTGNSQESRNDFENKLCEIVGEIYARLLTGNTIEWQTWDNSESVAIENAYQLLILNDDVPLSFVNSRNRNWGKLQVIKFDGNQISLDDGVRYIVIPAVEWNVQINSFDGGSSITRNSGVSINATPLNDEIAIRFNRDVREGHFAARLYYWREGGERDSIQLNWTGTGFTGRQLGTQPLDVGEYFWEFYLGREPLEPEYAENLKVRLC
jgi:hypothetical protein